MSAQEQHNEVWHGTLGEFYQRDHARLNSLWAGFLFLRSEGADAARDAFAAFRQGLERHMSWEDDLLFEELARRIDERGKLLTDLLTWEHQGLRRWLGRLAPSPSTIGLESDLQFTAFAGTLAGHNRREERVIYPLVDRLFDLVTVARVAAGMANARTLSSPDPLTVEGK